MNAKIGNHPDYRGMVVFLEGSKPGSSGSEIVVTEQSPHTLYGVRPGARDVWDAHYTYSYALVGENAHRVLSAQRDDRLLREMIVSIRDKAGAVKRGEKLQWSEPVYVNASRIADKLEQFLLCPCDKVEQIAGTTLRSSQVVGAQRITVIVEPA